MKVYLTSIIFLTLIPCSFCLGQIPECCDTLILRNGRDSVVNSFLSDGSIFQYQYKNEEINRFFSWYSDGSLKNEVEYVNGIQRRSISWNEIGYISSVLIFDHNGKRHGRQLHYHENGFLANESFFVNGFESGSWKSWHDNGVLESILEFNYDHRDSLKCQNFQYTLKESFDEDTGEYVESFMTFCLPPHGNYEEYSKSGVLIVKGAYNYGQKSDNWKTYSD